jgi:surface polysaccharide O-acyltransferase-like enzyme
VQSETTQPPASRFMWADFMRALGIFLVVLGHVSAISVQRYQSVTLPDWNAANIYNVIARACVPLLFMCSGAMLLSRQESLKDFYRKRFKKVIIPFLFWSVLYLLWKEGCFEFDGSFSQWRQGCYGNYTLINIIKVQVSDILTAPAEYHLWFMYELFAIYIFTPILRVFASKENEKYLWYLLAIWFIFGPVQRIVEFRLQVELIFNFGYLTGYVGYFILGYLLTRIRISKRLLIISALVYPAMAYFTVAATAYFTTQEGKLVDYFQFLLGINIVLLSTSLFILLKPLGEFIFSKPHLRLEKLTVKLSAASFGIYLVHVFIIALLKDFKISPLDGPSIYMVPVTTVGVFIVSWIIVAILMRIPILRATVA